MRILYVIDPQTATRSRKTRVESTGQQISRIPDASQDPWRLGWSSASRPPIRSGAGIGANLRWQCGDWIDTQYSLIPAQAGILCRESRPGLREIPACAGMSGRCVITHLPGDASESWYLGTDTCHGLRGSSRSMDPPVSHMKCNTDSQVLRWEKCIASSGRKNAGR